MAELIFVKLGGSLITDKRHEATPRRRVLRRMAAELRAALDENPALRIVLGHGSGSFGHWEANRYGTRQGVTSVEQWQGFARVAAAAAQLNRLVVDIFLEAGVPVLSLPPSASALAEDGTIRAWDDATLRRSLEHGLIPLIFGDVAFDTVRGGTILSTESLFVYLAARLHPQRILLFGNAPGVLDPWRRVLPHITPESHPKIEQFLRGSCCTDVTGGMADKVTQMVRLVERESALRVWILGGHEDGVLKTSLLDPAQTPGTCICAQAAG